MYNIETVTIKHSLWTCFKWRFDIKSDGLPRGRAPLPFKVAYSRHMWACTRCRNVNRTRDIFVHGSPSSIQLSLTQIQKYLNWFCFCRHLWNCSHFLSSCETYRPTCSNIAKLSTVISNTIIIWDPLILNWLEQHLVYQNTYHFKIIQQVLFSYLIVLFTDFI